MLCCVWCPRMLQVRRHQPFLLDMWRALSGVTSGIWETVHMEEEFDPPRDCPRAIERDPLVSDWGIRASHMVVCGCMVLCEGFVSPAMQA